MVITKDELERELIHTYRTGGGRTFYCGHANFGKHYSIKEGGVTDWTGYAGSGKTEFLLECLVNCSEWYGHKHLIYMPDAGTNAEVVGKLMHKISGKQFDEFFYNEKGERVQIPNRITEDEIKKLLPMIMEHFKIFDPSKASRSKAVTPKEYWTFAAENKQKLGIFSAVIDSWNYMRHDTEGFQREDKWLEDTLSFRNELAEKNELHLHTIIHPTKATKDTSGKIIMPDMHSLKGGSEWSNNGKSIIIVHRDFGSTVTQIKIDKAKPKIVGVQGIISISYDVKLGKYYTIDADQPSQKKYAQRIN